MCRDAKVFLPYLGEKRITLQVERDCAVATVKTGHDVDMRKENGCALKLKLKHTEGQVANDVNTVSVCCMMKVNYSRRVHVGSSCHTGGNSHPCHEQTQPYKSSGSEVKRAVGGDVDVFRAASGKKPLRVTLRKSR